MYKVDNTALNWGSASKTFTSKDFYKLTWNTTCTDKAWSTSCLCEVYIMTHMAECLQTMISWLMKTLQDVQVKLLDNTQ